MKLKRFNKRLGDGLWVGVPAGIYHQRPGMSSTAIRVLMESPLTFRRMMDGKLPRETTPAMEFGPAAHSAILENSLATFHIQPPTFADGSPWDNRKAEARAWNDGRSDKIIISAAQAAQLSEAANYVHHHPEARRVLSGGYAEVSAFSASGKARCDYLILSGDDAIVTDLKTTVAANRRAFTAEIVRRGYHIQAAWYRRILKESGARTVRFFFVALQKGPLPLVNVLELSTPAMDLGAREIDNALALLLKCEVNQQWPEWPDYDGSNEIKVVDLPEWAYPETTELEMDGTTIEV